ncbi:MAG: electron transfer flavoprotein subunit beta/FixA family protein [Candidatus Heimdallarchaeota archaeon]|nr:electron transfer flavoprotein subunit beta/FixA family protein [Candidatus Heimdallarchaeota archaeon]
MKNENNQLNLNIFVIIKQVPKQMKQTKEGLMDRSGKSIMNPHCSHALEEALSLRDKVGGIITVLSMGPINAQQSLHEALCMGADRAYLLSDRRLAGSDTWSTAEALATTINHITKTNNENIDVLFGGLQTIDGDTAQVPAQVAARLKMNQVTYVFNINVHDRDNLEVSRLIEKGYQRLKVPFPVTLSIMDTSNKPRGPSLSASMNARNNRITIFNIDDIGLKEEFVGITGSPTVVSRVKNVIIERDPVILYNNGSIRENVFLMMEAVNNKVVSK